MRSANSLIIPSVFASESLAGSESRAHTLPKYYLAAQRGVSATSLFTSEGHTGRVKQKRLPWPG